MIHQVVEEKLGKVKPETRLDMINTESNINFKWAKKCGSISARKR